MKKVMMISGLAVMLAVMCRSGEVGTSVAGAVDALPFAKRVLDNNSGETGGMQRFSIYMALVEQMGYEMSTPHKWKPSAAKLLDASPPFVLRRDKEEWKVDMFLLEKIETEEMGGSIELLDSVLCWQIPSYTNSVQRLAAVEKLLKNIRASRGDYFNRWNAVKEEIEKTPANERKDFRVKGELLDPERKEE